MKIRIRLKIPASGWDRIEEWSLFLFLVLIPPNLVMPPILRKLANLLGYLLAAFVFFRYWKRLIFTASKDWLLVAMVGLAIASIGWAVEPGITAESIRALTRTTIIGIYFATCYTPQAQRKIVSNILITWGVASLLAAAVPGYGITPSGKHAGGLVGIFSFKNSLAEAMAIGAITSVVTLLSSQRTSQRNQTFAKFCLAITPVLVFLTGSKTNLVAMLASFVVVPIFILNQQQSFKLKGVLYASGTLLSVGTVLLVANNLELIVVDWLGKDLTLTGRLPFWQAIVRQGMERPALGYGLGGFWNTEYALNAAYENGWPLLPETGTYLTRLHSHNGFVELFIQLGMIGLLLCSIHFVLLFFKLVYMTLVENSVDHLWMLQVLLLMLVINIAEAGNILEPASFLWVIYVAIALSSTQKVSKQQVSDRFDGFEREISTAGTAAAFR